MVARCRERIDVLLFFPAIRRGREWLPSESSESQPQPQPEGLGVDLGVEIDIGVGP